MRPGSPAQAARAAVSAVAVLACLSSVAALGAGSSYELDTSLSVLIDTHRDPDAKVFVDERGHMVLLIPFQPTLFLVDRSAGTAFALRKEHAVRSKDGATLKVRRELFAWSVPVSLEGSSPRFRIGASEVRVVEQARGEPDAEASAPPATLPIAPAPDPPAESSPGRPPQPDGPATPVNEPAGSAPAAGGPPATECVSLQTRPATGVPGCTRLVSIRNICEVPVVVLVQRTEHLMSGTLPQAFDTVVPKGEQFLGCAWWSGAMAPAKHEILGASYLTPPGKVAHGRHGTPPRR